MANQRFYPVYVALIVALGGFLLGFDGTVNSGAVPFYSQSLGIFDNSLLMGFSSGAIILGSIFGNLIAGAVGDRLGRKPALFITGLLFGFAALGTALAHHIGFFIAAKIIGGVGVGIAILIAPVYIAEVAPAELRGRLVSINQLNIVLGIFAAYFSNFFILQWVPNPELNWRWMLGVGAIPAFAYLMLLFLIPESPRWLMQRKQLDAARVVLNKMGGADYAAQEFAQIQTSLLANQHAVQKPGLRAELTQLFSRPMGRVLAIAFALALFQQLSGINSVLYYAPMVFETSGVGRDNAFLQTIILGVVFVLTTLLAMALIDKLGRKILLLAGCGIMAVSLLSVSAAFYNATFVLDKASMEKLNDNLYKQSIVEIATRNQPENYRHDRVVIDSINHLAQITYQNKPVASVDLQQPELRRVQLELEIVQISLLRLQDRKFNSDREFYAAVQEQLHSDIADALRTNSLAFSNKRAQHQTAKDIANGQFAKAKSQLLSSGIHINAMVVLLGLLGFIAGFSISLGPVTWTMLSEIFPNHLRGIGISVAGVLNATTSFVVASSFPAELDAIGSAATYCGYGVAMVLCLLFVWRFVPETKGKSLEELEQVLLLPKAKL